MVRLHAPLATAVAILAAIAYSTPLAQQRSLPTMDPQRIQDQDTMTWADYRPIPGKKWNDPAVPGERVLRVALVAIDFPDQPFVITMAKGSDLFGNPQVDPIKREDVARFYADFWGKPNAVNRGHTIHEYWMEQSRGKVGIPKIDAYGPYRMPNNLFQYGLNEWGQEGACPSGHECKHRMEPDADALWAADAGADIKGKYDIVLRIYAGYDETSVWQEFGEMKFQTKEDIPAEWGNPDTTKPRWAPTRYVPWTTWKAAAQQWGLSSVRQGENSGTITHEIAHFAFKTGDNNNNPYVQPYRRVGSGPWDIMDRGSFNGPGGPHRRWVVPANEGAAMPAGFMLRNRVRYEWLRPEQVLQLSRSALEQTGIAVASITARGVDPLPGEVAGIAVNLDGPAPQDRTPKCDMNAEPLCAGESVFNFYSVEVVQRIGNDSFTPDNGVLIAKNKNAEGRSCGYNCFTWVIDARPDDIKQVDYKKPDGTPVMRTIADYRQLNDALFHAGLNSGTEFEWKDEHNRLHFYVIDRNQNGDGILSYLVAVRAMDAAPQRRGVGLGGPANVRATAGSQVVGLTLTNTGAAATDAPISQQQDVYRLSVAVEGQGWTARLSNALTAVIAGRTAAIPVEIVRSADAVPNARLLFTAVSESDPRQRATHAIALSGR